jgi:hypothetical protein
MKRDERWLFGSAMVLILLVVSASLVVTRRVFQK